jgi:hypothetical protein
MLFQQRGIVDHVLDRLPKDIKQVSADEFVKLTRENPDIPVFVRIKPEEKA